MSLIVSNCGVENFVRKISPRELVKGQNAFRLLFFVVIERTDAFTLEKNIDRANFEVCLPAQLQIHQVVEKWLKVLDQVLVLVIDSLRALVRLFLDEVKGQVPP